MSPLLLLLSCAPHPFCRLTALLLAFAQQQAPPMQVPDKGAEGQQAAGFIGYPPYPYGGFTYNFGGFPGQYQHQHQPPPMHQTQPQGMPSQGGPMPQQHQHQQQQQPQQQQPQQQPQHPPGPPQGMMEGYGPPMPGMNPGVGRPLPDGRPPNPT